MGLANGTLSYLRFVAQGDMPEQWEEAWCEALQANGFHEIDPSSEVEQSCGWVRFDDAFEANWVPADLLGAGGLVLLRMRVDTLKVPAATLKAHLERAISHRCKTLGIDKLTRNEIEMLKLEVKKELRRRSLPRMQLVELAWNVGSGELRLMTTSRGTATHFVDLFEKTFRMELRVIGPRSVLWLRGMQAEALDALGALEPERFHLGVGGAA